MHPPITETEMNAKNDSTTQRFFRMPKDIMAVDSLIRNIENVDPTRCEYKVKSHSSGECVIDFKFEAPHDGTTRPPKLRTRINTKRRKMVNSTQGKTYWAPQKITYTIYATVAGANSTRRKKIHEEIDDAPHVLHMLTSYLDIICNHVQDDAADVYKSYSPKELIRIAHASANGADNASFFYYTLMMCPEWFDAAKGVIWSEHPFIEDIINTHYIYAGETRNLGSVPHIREQYIIDQGEEDETIYGDTKIVTYGGVHYVFVYTYSQDT